MTEKIIDPWLSDINRTIGDMVAELEAEKDLRASYERQCMNLEIQRELSHKTVVADEKLKPPCKGSKYSKSRLLCVPSGWATSSNNGSLNLTVEIDMLKSKIEQLENVNQELVIISS